MSLSNSRLSYTDCYELLDRALEEPRGLRFEVPNLDAALYMRLRLHHARAIDRAENMRTYKRDDPLYGRSVYDVFVVRVEEFDGCGWVYLDKLKVEIRTIEPIPEGHSLEKPLAPPRPVQLLEGPKTEIKRR